MMMRVERLGHARSGDKGDTANIAVIAWNVRAYEVLKRELTAERVRAYFGDRVRGEVVRYEAENLLALNFVMKGSLGGGGTVSLRMDAQGKTLGPALMRMEVECDDEAATGEPGGAGRAPDTHPA